MGLLERFQRAVTAGAVASPSISSLAQPPQRPSGGPDTDPRQWAYGYIHVDAIAARPFDPISTLARWCEQVMQDRSHVILRRFAGEHPEMTAVYLDMRRLGFALRQQVGTYLHRQYGLFQTVDPARELNYSRARIMNTLCRLHGIELVRMNDSQKLAAAKYSGSGRIPVYAFLQTFATMRAPILAVDIHPYGDDRGGPHTSSGDVDLWNDNTNQWTYAAACCLAKYMRDEEIYAGRGATPDIIAPFDPQYHAGIIPLTHVFAKALLHWGWHCDEEWPCECNAIEDLLNDRPEAHPWATGVLPAGVVRSSQGPQQPRDGYASPASPSRAMTPPRGMSGELLRQYNEQRRSTDPNLGTSHR